MNITRFLNPIASVGALCLLTACGNNEKMNTETESTTEPVADATQNEVPSQLESADDKISYMIGFQTASRYVNDPILALDEDLLIQGIKDALAGKKPAVSDDEAQVASQELQQRHDANQSVETEKAQAAGVAFLASNKDKSGIVTTDSGLQYEVLTKGDSDQSPVSIDTVKVHYHGTLIDGSVFDSSVDRGEPISFALNGVIPGWTEGLQLMAIGDKFRFYIPSELGYGARESGPIPPHSVLIFDVELLGVNEK